MKSKYEQSQRARCKHVRSMVYQFVPFADLSGTPTKWRMLVANVCALRKLSDLLSFPQLNIFILNWRAYRIHCVVHDEVSPSSCQHYVVDPESDFRHFFLGRSGSRTKYQTARSSSRCEIERLRGIIATFRDQTHNRLGCFVWFCFGYLFHFFCCFIWIACTYYDLQMLLQLFRS